MSHLFIEADFDDQYPPPGELPCDCHRCPRVTVGYLRLLNVLADPQTEALDLGIRLCRETCEIIRDAARRVTR